MANNFVSKEMGELKIENNRKKTIENKSSKLLGDLNLEKEFEVERIKKMEIKLEIISYFKKTFVSHFKTKILCITEDLKVDK